MKYYTGLLYIFHCCAKKARVKYFHRAELTEDWENRSTDTTGQKF